MAFKQDKLEWELPHFKEVHQMDGQHDFYSVTFYPYTEPGVDPVFAVAGERQILICRPPCEEASRTEVILYIEDDDADASPAGHYSCVWSKNLETGAPLLCVAGSNGKIKIIDALTGEKIRTLLGHGGEIYDLAISPINPYILASASEDESIRIWSLDPAHIDQPCAAILEGGGHREHISTIAFHATGRYLLSGGVDHLINLWILPEFQDSDTPIKHPAKVYYPHFTTCEVHLDCRVDCVAWCQDLILSKVDREVDNAIVLWGINGFSSSKAPPPPVAAPVDDNHDTRTAFLPKDSNLPPYIRYAQFAIPESSIYFTRFSLFPGVASTDPNLSHAKHPVLAFCNYGSKVFFWDLSRLTHYNELLPSFTSSTSSSATPAPNLEFLSTLENRKHPFLNPVTRRNRGGGAIAPTQNPHHRLREVSPSESTTSHNTSLSHDTEATPQTDAAANVPGGAVSQGGKGKVDWPRTLKKWENQYDIRSPSKDIEAHHTETVKHYLFTGRQVAWSAGGEWCVVVGSAGVIAVLGRWGKTS